MKFLLAIFSMITLNSCLMEYTLVKVKKSENTYIKFIFPKSVEEINILSGKQGMYKLFIQIYDQKGEYFFIPNYQSINPDGHKWLYDYKCYPADSYIFQTSKLYFNSSVPSNEFLYNYEYMVQIPVGKSKLRFLILEENKKYEGYVIYTKEVNIIPNQILSVNFSKLSAGEGVAILPYCEFIPCVLRN
ncbi:hypothetical protein [Leptospira wolbachii]|nr:hypothetical protein [Leptospira wolbachii]